VYFMQSGTEPDLDPGPGPATEGPLPLPAYSGGPVEFDRVVPPSGNMQVAGRQYRLGPARTGITVTFWADCDIIQMLIAGARVKSVRSHCPEGFGVSPMLATSQSPIRADSNLHNAHHRAVSRDGVCSSG
jgi:hypothetical protein